MSTQWEVPVRAVVETLTGYNLRTPKVTRTAGPLSDLGHAARGDHRDDRIATGGGVIGSQDDRQTVGRKLNGALDHRSTRKGVLRSLDGGARQADSDPVGLRVEITRSRQQLLKQVFGGIRTGHHREGRRVVRDRGVVDDRIGSWAGTGVQHVRCAQRRWCQAAQLVV